MPGYIYLATNPAMPGLTKIGFTESVLSERFLALQTTGVPFPFQLFSAFYVDDPRSCEQALHGLLTDLRVSENREFFRIEGKDALQRILPLVLSNIPTGPKNETDSAGLFSDLNSEERDVLAAYAMAPSQQRPHDWPWLRRIFGMSELDARHMFDGLRKKGYLREIRGRAGTIFYDLSSRGVSYGLMARETDEYQLRYGYIGFYYQDRG